MKKNLKSLEIPVTEDLAGLRVDKALGMDSEIGSRSRAEFLIESGLVKIADKIAYSAQKLKLGQVIHIEIPIVNSDPLAPLDLKLDIIFEDDDLVVVNKPAGLVVHPAAGHINDTLVNALVDQIDNLSMGFGEERPGIVHRLDRDTSGLLVVAKNDFIHEGLAAQFKAKTTHRVYEAVVWGRPHAKEMKVQSFLSRHPTERKRYASVLGADRKIVRHPGVLTQGKWAATFYSLVQTTVPPGFRQEISLLRLQLETGRTHQIRVHMSELGHPLIADSVYNRKSNETFGFGRLALHAGELGFVHPRTQQKMMFKTPWPEPEALRIKELFKPRTE